MEKNLDHLSEDEIQVLMQRYYNGENVAALIKEYRISARASELYKLFPPQICENYECEYCGEFLVIDRVSKSVYGKTRYDIHLTFRQEFKNFFEILSEPKKKSA